MVGAIIGAAVSVGSAVANYLRTSKQNKELRERLASEKALAKQQEITDRYGDWRYSGANLYFNKAADEVKDYVRQQRAARRVTGAQGTGAEEAAGKAIAQAAGQAAAQRQAVGLDMAMQDRKRQQELTDKMYGVDSAQSAATTQALTQAAGAGAQIAGALDNNSTANNTTVTNPNNTTTPAEKPIVAVNPSDPAYVKPQTGTTMTDYAGQIQNEYLQNAFKPVTAATFKPKYNNNGF